MSDNGRDAEVANNWLITRTRSGFERRLADFNRVEASDLWH
jgi:hypothetical protein